MSKLIGGMFTKLFLSSLLLSVFLFAVLLLYTVTGARRALEDQKAQDTSLLVGRTDQYLDLYLQNVSNVLLLLAETHEDRGGDRVLLQESMQGAAQANAGIIGGIYLIEEDRTVVASDQLVYTIVGHPHLADLLDLAVEKRAEAGWTRPYYSPLMTAKTVAFLRILRSSTGETTGVLAVEVNLGQLQFHLADMLVKSGQSFAVLTPEGDVVAMDEYGGIIPTSTTRLPPQVPAAFIATLQGLPVGLGRLRHERRSFTTVRSNRNKLGWDLLILIEDTTYRRNILTLYANFLRIGGLFLVVLVVGTILVSRHFSHPIHRLAAEMDLVDDPQQLRIPKSERRDEIGALYRSFRFMIDRITQLVREQREADLRRRQVELKLLHSQIRPHFVSNTLACIASLAKQNKREEVVETLRSLILLLSTTADQIEELVTLREEMACLEAYVQLQKMRYRDLFSYQAVLDEGCLDCRVPKLLLEPLVENAVFHGFAEQTQGGVIRVTAEPGDGYLGICVEDNGRGIEPERLAQIRSSLTNHQAEVAMAAEGRFSSIGLRNTHERLRLTFGDRYGLSIESTSGAGTIVAVRVPLILGRLDAGDLGGGSV